MARGWCQCGLSLCMCASTSSILPCVQCVRYLTHSGAIDLDSGPVESRIYSASAAPAQVEWRTFTIVPRPDSSTPDISASQVHDDEAGGSGGVVQSGEAFAVYSDPPVRVGNLHASLPYTHDLVADFTGGDLYYTEADTGKVWAMSIATGSSRVVASGLHWPMGLSLSFTEGQAQALYVAENYADDWNGRISSLDLSTAVRSDVIPNDGSVVDPAGVALDPSSRTLFISTTNVNVVGHTSVFSVGVESNPSPLTELFRSSHNIGGVSVAGGRVFAGFSSSGGFLVMKTDGSSPETWHTELPGVYRVKPSTDGQYLYFSQFSAEFGGEGVGRLYRVDAADGANLIVLIDDRSEPWSFAVDGPPGPLIADEIRRVEA